MQLLSMYYLLYKEMPFLPTLASMSFFKRSGTYNNVYCFGRVGYKNDVKTANKYGNMFFMQASDSVINYLNKDKFFVALSTSKNAIFICLGEIRILG